MIRKQILNLKLDNHIVNVVRPEKFQFLEKWQNSNFGQKSRIYSLDLG